MNDPAPLVYLVDDDEAVRSALRLLLETVGQRVMAFAEPMTFLARLFVSRSRLHCARYPHAGSFRSEAPGAACFFGM